MPKKKRVWTPEQREAARLRGKAMWAKRAAESKAVEKAEKAGVPLEHINQTKPVFPESAVDPSLDNMEAYPRPSEANEDTLTKRVLELEGFIKSLQQQPAQTQQLTSQGNVIGTHTKWSLNAEDYKDPSERLLDEPKLAQHAPRHWYEIKWEVKSVRYPLQDGRYEQQPQFTLEVIFKVHDDDGELTNKRFVARRGIFFWDPDAAIEVARLYGLPINNEAEKQFLDEMMYLRYRDWWFEIFYPAKSIQPKQNKREMVIGNKLVEVYEANSETFEEVPFNQMKGKIEG